MVRAEQFLVKILGLDESYYEPLHIGIGGKLKSLSILNSAFPHFDVLESA